MKLVTRKASSEARQRADKIIRDVHKKLGKEYKFFCRPIGSQTRRCIVQDKNGKYDLDYQIVLTQNSKGDLDPTSIKKRFLWAFTSVRNKNEKVEDSTTVITVAFDFLKRNDCYSFSAPTSLGKTFIIRMLIKEEILKGERSNFVIVVPTNALINELYGRIVEDLNDNLWNKKYKVVKSPAAVIDEEDEKVKSIAQLFGTRITRNETINEDEYQYIRPYKKTITPFTAEVSAAVFASAENSPLEYVIKNFYPNKSLYPEQIQKLQLLIEELATLKEAKQIIENYKKEYQQYLTDVPEYVMTEDSAGFYSKLGFANIDESVLTVEYTFSYTSGGGMAKRKFTVPMTEETIVDLIEALEGKLTISAFTKEQRALMTNKLREHIKERDHFTCCSCGNSIYAEPNLLLEIDHIIPVSKGGHTTEENLQTLCWKCNRAKSNKI